MHRVRLIHWNADEAEGRVAMLRAGGYDVEYEPFSGPGTLRVLREDAPSAVVIDLSRLPMQGRDVGLAVRHYKSSRSVPLVFVGGAPPKVARVQESLPDAVYTTWDEVLSSLRDVIGNPPPVLVAPPSILAGYSGTPLVKKLGIKPNAVVALVNAPAGFEELLGELPEGATLRRQHRGRRNLTIWFVRSCEDLADGIARMAPLAEHGPLWIVLPKKTSRLASDLTQDEVRTMALATGLVDYKVCAVDETWYGLLFARRSAK